MKLSSLEQHWLLKIQEGILPSGVNSRIPIGASDVPMRSFNTELARVSPLEASVGMRAAIIVITLSPIWRQFRPRLFGSLSLEQRGQLLTSLAASNVYFIREIPNLLKMLTTLGFCGLPVVQRAVGIPMGDAETPAWAKARQEQQ